MSSEPLARTDHAEHDDPKRELAKSLFDSGHKINEISEMCHLPIRTVAEWMKGWRTFEHASNNARELVGIIQDAAPEQVTNLLDVQSTVIEMMGVQKNPSLLKALASTLKMNYETMLDLCRCGGALAPVQEKGQLNVQVANVSGNTEVQASETQTVIRMVDDVGPSPPSTAAEKIERKLAMVDDQKRQQAVLKDMAGPAPIAPIDVERERNHGETTGG